MNNMDSNILHLLYEALLSLSPVPRSLEYRNGVLSSLLFLYQGRSLVNPYRLGTCESDAFLAGYESTTYTLALVSHGKSFPGSQSIEVLLNKKETPQLKTSCECALTDRGLPL